MDSAPGGPPAPSPPAAETPPPAPPRKRRWKKILGVSGGVLLGLLVLAALLIPPVAGAVLRSKIPSVLGEALSADVLLADASFSWSGRVLLEGLKITPKGFADPLLDIPRMRADVSLFSALSGTYIADVEVDQPRVLVERDAHGRFNYQVPPRPSTPSDRGSSGGSKEKPAVRAVLRVRGGSVTVRAAGRESAFRDLTVDAKVDGLDQPIPWSLSLQEGLRAEGDYSLDTAKGRAKLEIRNLALANLTAAARAWGDPSFELAGTLDASASYAFDGLPAFSGRAQVNVRNLDLRHRGRAYGLEALSFLHEGGLDPAGAGKNRARIESGLFDLDLDAQVRDAFAKAGAQTALRLDVRLGPVVAFLRKAGLLKADLAADGTVSLKGSAGAFPIAWDLKTTSPRVALTLDGKPILIEGVSHESKGTIDDAGNGSATLNVFSGKALDARLAATLTDLYKAPAVDAALAAASDLAELGRMLEKALGLKAGLSIEGTSKLDAKLAYKGRDARVDLTARTSDLAAVDAAKKRIPLDKEILLELGAGWNGATKTATADRLKLTSSFATADGKGGATVGETLKVLASTLSLDADLAGLAAKLGAILEKPPALAGKASLRAKAEGEAVSVDGTFTGVKVEGYGPLDATLRHHGTIDAKGDGRHVVRLESAKALTADLTADLKSGAVEARFTLGADLGGLAAALPGLIELKPGVGLEGKATVSGTAGRKGEAASFDVQGELSDLAAVEKKARTEIDKLVTFGAAGAWDGAKKALDLKTLTLRSSMATADAKGGFTLSTPLAIRESSFMLGADLAKIGAKLGLILADPPKLAGLVDAKGAYAGEAYDVTATASGLKVGAKGPIDATLVQKGRLSLAPGGGLAIETGELKSSAVQATLSGAIRRIMDPAREGEVVLSATVLPGELSKWIPDLGWAGEAIPISAKVSLKPDLVTASGTTEVKLLKMGPKTAKAKPVTFDVQMKGDDLVAKLRTELVEWAEPAYAAKTGLEADVVYSPKGTSGTTKLVNLEVVDDKKNVVKEPALTLTHDVGISKGVFDLRKADVEGGFLRGGLTGKVKTPGPAFEGLRGTFRYHPDKLGAVLKPFMPGALAGAEEKTITFTLTGTSLADAKGEVDVDIPRYTHTGVTVSGKATLGVEKGVVRTRSPLEVNKGRTDMNATIDLREAKDKPLSTIDFNAKDVDANADMAPFLSSINPIFHTVNGAVAGKSTADFRLTWTGPIDLATKDWEKAAKEPLRGSGTLAVRDLVITGSPAVGLIMQAMGEGNELRGELLGTAIQVRDGACHYQNMTLRLARYELRFTGWVAFDKRMELQVEMPLTPGMRKRYPNLEKYTGQSIKVPLTGTAASPRLDFEKVIQNLIKDAAPALLEDALKKLLERQQKKKDK